MVLGQFRALVMFFSSKKVTSPPIVLQNEILVFEISSTGEAGVTGNRKKIIQNGDLTHFEVPFRLSRSPPCIIKFGMILKNGHLQIKPGFDIIKVTNYL